MKAKEFKEDLDQVKKSTISKSIFEIIKKCLEIDNSLSTSELSNKIFEEKRVKISSEAFWRHLVS